jgi:tetratricopeptide (TPR) repeat protein
VDNLDLILDALPEQDQHWQLRRRLQAAGGPILFGAAAQVPRQVGDRDSAFYEFFRLHSLDPLTEPELRACLGHLADLRGQAGQPVRDVLARQPGRLRVLHTLTGGNPRILAMLYQLLERVESANAFQDLEALLDQLTPLYKSRVEDLRSDQQRAALDAIALHWDPITAHDLSVAMTLPVTTVSSLLSRLRDYGYIEEVPTSGARAGYQVIERFFNIWYLMRHGTRRTRQKVRWLAAFLEVFYTRDDLHRLLGSLRPVAQGAWHPMLGEAVAMALGRLDGPTSASPADPGDAAQRGEAELRAALAQDADDADAWRQLGVSLMHDPSRLVEAEFAFRQAIVRDVNSNVSWFLLGLLLTGDAQQHTEAESAFREMITRTNPNRGSLLPSFVAAASRRRCVDACYSAILDDRAERRVGEAPRCRGGLRIRQCGRRTLSPC